MNSFWRKILRYEAEGSSFEDESPRVVVNKKVTEDCGGQTYGPLAVAECGGRHYS
jgi:hypothetical protein